MFWSFSLKPKNSSSVIIRPFKNIKPTTSIIETIYSIKNHIVTAKWVSISCSKIHVKSLICLVNHSPSNSSRQGAVLSGSDALVPPWKADWSVPDEPKASGKTFFLLSFYYNSLYFDYNIHSFIILSQLLFIYIPSSCLSSLIFHLFSATNRSQPVE